MENIEKEGFRDRLLDWYEKSGRSFYWRENELTPFQVLIVEMLLKRTRAETVDKEIVNILNEISGPEDVLEMEKDELVELLRPLGLYNRRSKNISNVCNELVENFDGDVPDKREELTSVNGIGDYIADAILCFAYKKPVLVLDTNTAKVARFFFGFEIPEDLRQDEEIREELEPLVPEEGPEKFNWAMIDLGSELRKGATPDLGIK